ncbi:MAG: helix-turn-helix domain-containing protein [Thermoprotei archaeon]
MPRKINLIKHMSKEELEEAYKKEKNTRIKERLLAILNLYEGKTEEETAKTIKRGVRTIRYWLKRWNEEGYQGLTPHLTGGPKPRMNKSEWEKVVKEIEGKGMSVKDVMIYVKTTRGVKYAYKTVWKVLRKDFGVRETVHIRHHLQFTYQ